MTQVVKLRLVPISLIFCVLATIGILGQSKGSKSPSTAYRAVISENEAIFTFPIKLGQKYEWCPGGLQYEWSANIDAGNQETYAIGFSLITPQGASLCESGDITKLLKAGHLGMFKQAKTGSFDISGLTENGFAAFENTYSDEFFVERFKVTAAASANTLTIRLSGPKTIKILFAGKPRQAVMASQIGLFRARRTTPVAIKYSQSGGKSPTPTQAKQIPSCLDNSAAIELLRESIPEGDIKYTIDEAISYKPHESLAEVKDGWPLAALFNDFGYIRLEAPGYVFHFITPKGTALNQRFPDGVPIANKSIAKVDKIKCVGKKLRIEFSYNIIPTDVARSLFGQSINRIKSINTPWRSGVEFSKKGDKWALIEASRPYFLLD